MKRAKQKAREHMEREWARYIKEAELFIKPKPLTRFEKWLAKATYKAEPITIHAVSIDELKRLLEIAFNDGFKSGKRAKGKGK